MRTNSRGGAVGVGDGAGGLVGLGAAVAAAGDGLPEAVVTAAGRSLMGAHEDITIDEAKQHFDINFFGTIRVIRAVLPTMREQRAGKIILIGSIGGLIGLQYLSYYSAAKFALNGLVEAASAVSDSE